MRVFDLLDKDNCVFAFEVSNIGLGRMGAVKVVKGIPNVTVLKEPRKLFCFDEEVFCEFAINGRNFQLMEPFGDNSRYWIGPRDNVKHPEIALIRQAFADR